MRHQKKGKKLGRTAAPRKALFRSLVTSFVIYEKIKTTQAKAKALRPIMEKIITLSKYDSLLHRIQDLRVLYLEDAVKKLFEVIGPRYKDRNGGYTRVVKLMPRKNDSAETAIL